MINSVYPTFHLFAQWIYTVITLQMPDVIAYFPPCRMRHTHWAELGVFDYRTAVLVWQWVVFFSFPFSHSMQSLAYLLLEGRNINLTGFPVLFIAMLFTCFTNINDFESNSEEMWHYSFLSGWELKHREKSLQEHWFREVNKITSVFNFQSIWPSPFWLTFVTGVSVWHFARETETSCGIAEVHHFWTVMQTCNDSKKLWLWWGFLLWHRKKKKEGEQFKKHQAIPPLHIPLQTCTTGPSKDARKRSHRQSFYWFPLILRTWFCDLTQHFVQKLLCFK